MFSASASRWKIKAHDLIWSWRGLFWVSESFITSTVGSLCFWQELCLPLLKNLTTEPVRFGLALEDQELATVQATKEYSTDMYRLDQCQQCKFMWTPRDWIDHSYFVAVRVSHDWAYSVGLWLIEHCYLWLVGVAHLSSDAYVLGWMNGKQSDLSHFHKNHGHQKRLEMVGSLVEGRVLSGFSPNFRSCLTGFPGFDELLPFWRRKKCSCGRGALQFEPKLCQLAVW